MQNGLIKDALKEFNKWRDAEAVAKLAGAERDFVIMEVGDPLCRSRGVYDHFENIKMN